MRLNVTMESSWKFVYEMKKVFVEENFHWTGKRKFVKQKFKKVFLKSFLIFLKNFLVFLKFLFVNFFFLIFVKKILVKKNLTKKLFQQLKINKKRDKEKQAKKKLQSENFSPCKFFFLIATLFKCNLVLFFFSLSSCLAELNERHFEC